MAQASRVQTARAVEDDGECVDLGDVVPVEQRPAGDRADGSDRVHGSPRPPRAGSGAPGGPWPMRNRSAPRRLRRARGQPARLGQGEETAAATVSAAKPAVSSRLRSRRAAEAHRVTLPRSRMRESRTSGFVRGAPGGRRLYSTKSKTNPCPRVSGHGAHRDRRYQGLRRTAPASCGGGPHWGDRECCDDTDPRCSTAHTSVRNTLEADLV